MTDLATINRSAAEVEAFYATVPVEARLLARACANDIRTASQKAAVSILEIGQLLLRARDRLPHGTFLTWTAREFPHWSSRHLYRFINAAEHREFATRVNSAISLRVLGYLAGPSVPEEAREEIAGRVEAGEPVTLADAQETTRRHVQTSTPRPSRLSPEALAAIDTVKAAARIDLVREKIGRSLDRIRSLHTALPNASSLARLLERYESAAGIE